jgi:protease I
MLIQGLKVAVIIADGFEQDHFYGSVEALRSAGAVVDILAENAEKLRSGIQGMDFVTPREKVQAQRTVLNALPEEYDGLLIPGGAISCDQMRESILHLGFIKHFIDSGKPIAAMGHAACLLADAEVLHGKTLTSPSSIRKNLERAGAIWQDREVIVDGALITSRSAKDVSVFARAFIEQLSQMPHMSHDKKRAA